MKFSRKIVHTGLQSETIVRSDELMAYYRDVERYPLLSDEEEKELFYVFRNGTPAERQAAREKIINANLRFVISIARQYGKTNTVMDLISEGNIGLYKAVESFDPALGNSFLSYAVWYIRREINAYRVNMSTLVKPKNVAKTYHLLSQVRNKFYQENQRLPTSVETMNILNEKYNLRLSSPEDLSELKISYIDEHVDKDGYTEGIFGGDMLDYFKVSSSYNDSEKVEEKDSQKSLVKSLTSILTPREREIILLSFGIGEYREWELCEIAEKMNLTKERVRQLKKSALRRMKKEFSKRLEHI